MVIIKTQGIVIKRINFGEADKIITLLTKDRGKIRVVAKGVRKPKARLAGFLDLFHYNEYLIAEGRNLDIITSASTVENWHGINQSLQQVALAYYMAETIDKLIEETQEIGDVFDLIYFNFRTLHQNEINLNVLKSFFEINIVSALGYKPELEKCIECNQTIQKDAWFSFALGGILDSSHKNNDLLALPLSLSDLKILKGMYINNVQELQSVNWVDKISPQLSKISNGFLNYIIDRNIKSQEFLNEVIDF